MQMIRIIHLSDFHLNNINLADWKNYIKKALLKRLSDLNSDVEITFIAFTGDMIDLGGQDFGSAEKAFAIFKDEIIDSILETLKIPIERFLTSLPL